MSNKVGILTFSNAYNYGALLQAYALQSMIASLGYEAYVIRFEDPFLSQAYEGTLHLSRQKGLENKLKFVIKMIMDPREAHKWKKKVTALRRFAHSEFNFTEPYTPATIQNSNKCIDTFVVGSDQVWNTKLYGYLPCYFGSFVSKGKNLISYAASFGKESISGYEYQLLKDNLPKYSAISMRERSGCEILKKYLNVESENVLDPTFLQNNGFWDKVAEKSKLRIKRPYVLLSFVHEHGKIVMLAEEYAREHGFEIYSVNTLEEKIKYHDVSDASVEDFLYLIKHAACVFTTSFHALALSINFNTDLYYELSDSPFNANSRIVDLCSALGLSHREAADRLNEKEIDWNRVNKKLNEMREKSIGFLKRNL